MERLHKSYILITKKKQIIAMAKYINPLVYFYKYVAFNGFHLAR